MKMKLNWVVLASALVTISCGGKKGEDDGGPTVQSTTKECQKGCDQAAECEGAPLDFAETCNESCEEIVDVADEVGCLEEIDVLAKCSAEEFRCVATTTACESEAEDYAICVMDAEDAEKEISAEACREACSLAARCEGAPADYEDTCNEACNNLVEEAYDAGCSGELDSYLKCSKDAFDCEGTEAACADESEDFSVCMFDDE